ncbi:MAG: aldehyde-activating protein [Thiotrichales bacterium]|nr:aldehyde-activating protein [Thiotrichales bacterium]
MCDPTSDKTTASGGCQCGAVRFTVSGSLRPIVYCHCEQCRRSSGHFVAASASQKDKLKLESEDHLAWYRSSDIARRAFCRVCGSNLFWQSDSADHVSIMAGCLDQPTGLEAAEHIYVHSKADYYEVNDGLPQHPEGQDLSKLYDSDRQK